MSAYNESDHPRDPRGQYTNKPGANSTSGVSLDNGPTQMPDFDAPITDENLDNFLEAADLNQGNAEYEIGEHSWVSMEGPKNATVSVDISECQTMDDVYREAAYTLETFDPDDEFDELWPSGNHSRMPFSAREFLRMLDDDKEHFDEVRTNLGKARTAESSGAKLDSDLADLPARDAPVTDDNLDNFLGAADLDHGSAEYDIEQSFLAINGPNDTVRQVEINGCQTMGDIYREVQSSIEDFDPDDAFDELWPSGNHSGMPFSAREFLRMLDEDEEHFNEVSSQIREVRNGARH